MQNTKLLTIEELKAEKCRRSLHFFLTEFWEVIIPEPFVDAPHIKFLCDEVQKVGERIVERKPKLHDLIINITPGTTKSTIATVVFPVWLWINDPTARVITGSHSIGLSLDHAVKSRDIVNSEKFAKYFPEFELKRDNNVKSYYSNTKGGSRSATSVGSKIIGKHAHVIIVDDAVSGNPTQLEIEEANKWITSDLSTRKVDKRITPTILIMQRVHDNDPTGFLLKRRGDKIRHICLPAELTDDVKPIEARDMYKDGLMDPVRLNREILKEMKEDLGSYGYSSQCLQNPTPADGGIIKHEWFKVVPSSVLEELQDVAPYFWVDTAYTDNEENDPSAISVTKFKDNILYVLHSTEQWLEFPDLLKFCEDYFSEWDYRSSSRVFVEPKASGLSVVQSFRKTRFNVIESKAPRDSKDTRLRAVSPLVEAGKIVFVEGVWNELQREQLTNVRAVHDDVRDTIVMAMEYHLVKNKNKGKYNYR